MQKWQKHVREALESLDADLTAEVGEMKKQAGTSAGETGGVLEVEASRPFV